MHGFACSYSVRVMWRRRLLLALAAFCVFALPSVLAIAASARADTVTDWNATAAAALQSPGTVIPPAVPGAGQGAVSTAHLAMVHTAVYDAVNAIDGGHEPYVSSPAAEPWYSQDAAVAAAARHVLINGGLGVPAARLPVIESAYQATLAGIPPGPSRDAGIATREAAATALLASRAGDGRFGALTFKEGMLPGEWRPTSGVIDPGAWLQGVRPFVLRDPDLFRARSRTPCTRARTPPTSTRSRRSVGDRLDQDAGADGRRELLGPGQRHRDDSEHPALGRERSGRHPGRPRPPVRPRLHERRGRADRDLARQGPVQLLAADHRDPRGRERRQRRHGARSDLDLPDRGAALPRPPVGAVGVRLLGRGDAAALLRPRRRDLQRHKPRVRPARSRASRRCATTSSTRGCGPASTSGSQTRRPRRSGGGSPTGATGTPSADPGSPWRPTAPGRAEDRVGADARGQRAPDAPVGLGEPPGAQRVDHRRWRVVTILELVGVEGDMGLDAALHVQAEPNARGQATAAPHHGKSRRCSCARTDAHARMRVLASVSASTGRRPLGRAASVGARRPPAPARVDEQTTTGAQSARGTRPYGDPTTALSCGSTTSIARKAASRSSPALISPALIRRRSSGASQAA